MPRDIGGYFERLTRRGPGGRRLDDGGTGSPARPTGRSGSGGIRDALKDLVDKGRRRVRPSGRRSERRELPPESTVTVEYSPDMDDGDPDPGEIVWTWVPFEEDPDQGKDRPVVVIGRRNRRLVGIPLTTKRNDREAQIAIGTGGWDPKRRESYVRIWRMLDLDPGGMRREGAVLDRHRFDEIVAAVDRYYEVRRVPRSADRQQDGVEYEY